MSDQSSMSNTTTSEATSSATSLQASASGPLPFDELAGQPTEKSGQPAARVSLSQRLAKAGVLQTNGISGRSSGLSQKTLDLRSSLVSRLQARTVFSGSTLYSVTWKQRAMQTQPSIWQLRASALRTSGSESTGWVTPSSRDWKDTIGMLLQREAGRSRVDQLPRQAGLVLPGQTLSGSAFLTERRGQCNPALARWLMSIPPEWDACVPTATQLSKK